MGGRPRDNYLNDETILKAIRIVFYSFPNGIFVVEIHRAIRLRLYCHQRVNERLPFES